MRLVEVLRVSTDEQARGDRAGLDRQRNNTQRRATELSASIIKTITITEVSRTSVVRTPEWQQILLLIHDPDTHIVVDAADRLVAGFEGMEILAQCKASGTRIFTSTGELDLRTAAGRLVGAIQSLFSSDELDSIRHRVQQSKEAKRRAGLFPSADLALPTGIAYLRERGPDGLTRGRWTYTREIDRVRRVFELFVQGETNLRAVGRATGFSGVTTRNLLQNPIYKGLWIVDERRDTSSPAPIDGRGRRRDRRKVARAPSEIIRHQIFRLRGEAAEPGDAREEAAVHEATWDAAQRILAQKRAAVLTTREPNYSRFFYTGHVWCSACILPMWGRGRRGRSGLRRDYYACKCTQSSATKSCGTGYIRREILHASIDRLLSTFFADEHLLAALVDAASLERRGDHLEQLDLARRELHRHESSRSRLLELYLDGSWDRAELDARRVGVDADVNRASREVRRLEDLQRSLASTSVIDQMREVFQTLHEFEFWQPNQKRNLVRKYFPRISVSRSGIETVRMQLPMVASIAGHEVVAEDHELPLDVKIRAPWSTLTPPSERPMTDFGLPEQPFYTRADVRGVLGLTEHQLREAMRRHEVQEPANRRSGKRAWSPEELRTLVTEFRERRAPWRWGLPAKAHYTTGDVVGFLGTGWERLRYLIQTGVVTDCAGKDAQGHRRWTEAEVERAISEFTGHKRTPAALEADTHQIGVRA